LAGFSFFNLFPGFPFADLLKAVSAAVGLLGLGVGGYYMIKLYRIPARPFWNHWHTDAAFVGNAFSLGGLLLTLLALVVGVLTPKLANLLAMSVCFGLALEAVGLLAHARTLKAAHSEGAASFYEQTTTYGYPYWLRNGLLGLSLLLALAIVVLGNAPLFVPLTLAALTAAIIGRALFYVLVIPTTMPGAFFWRNRGFEEHARQTGLAAMPQVGVVPDSH
jgi:DMSO reductase anchor subunit